MLINVKKVFYEDLLYVTTPVSIGKWEHFPSLRRLLEIWVIFETCKNSTCVHSTKYAATT